MKLAPQVDRPALLGWPYRGLARNGRLPVAPGANVTANAGRFFLPSGKEVLPDGFGGYYHSVAQQAVNRAIWNGDTEAYSGGVGVRYKAFFNGQISAERGTSFVQRGREAAAPIRVGAALARDNANGWSWRDYQLLHGAARQIGNVAVNGVVFADVHGVNWRLDLGPMHAVQNQLTDNSVSFNIPISRFGHWTTNPATAPTALTVSIANMGQSTPALTVGPKTIFTGGPGDPFEPDRADLYRCRLYVCDITPRGDKVLLAYGGLWYGCDTPESQVYLVHPRPLAFIELSFFSGASTGQPPTVSAIVLKDRQACCGSWTHSESAPSWVPVGGVYYALLGAAASNGQLSGVHVWAYYDQTGSPQYLTLDRVDNNNDTLTGSLSVQSNNVTILSGAFASVAEFVSSITLHAPGGSLSAVLQINTTRNWSYDPGSDRFDLATTQTLSVTRSGLPDINETTNGFQNDVGVNFIADTESGGIPGNPSPNVKPEPLNLKQRFQMELFQESEYVNIALTSNVSLALFSRTATPSGFTPLAFGSSVWPGGVLLNASGSFASYEKIRGEFSTDAAPIVYV